MRTLPADDARDYQRGETRARGRPRAGVESRVTPSLNFQKIGPRSPLSRGRARRNALNSSETRMKGDPKVIEYLNAGLRHELTAINQYWLHYRLLDNWGYKALAKKWRKESIEEMEHADKLTVRIIFLEGFPNMQVLDPLHIGQTVKEVLECDLRAELHARALYEEAATHCHAVKDYVSRDLFEKLMRDEEHHIGKLGDDDHD